MSGFLLQCIVGCILYSVGLIIPRKSPCIFEYIFSLNLEVIQLKLLKGLAQISLPAYGDYLLRRFR
jgi:hypothetical protein